MHFILGLLSAVALLAYGVSVTKNTVLRALGSSIDSVINRSLNSSINALGVGLGTTMLVQSSTATSLLVSSFMKKGVLSLGTALVIMLGADLGTAVMVRILTYDLSLLCPLLLTVGTFFYLSSAERPKLRNFGGIALGLGLILLSLSLIVKATQPVLKSNLTYMLMESLTGQIAFSILLGAVLAVICYSSLAAVLLTSLLTSSGSIGPQSAIAVVIGANLGSCLLEIMGAQRQGADAKRVMLGNTIFKLAIALICVPILPQIEKLQQRTIELSEFVLWFHVGFNAIVCLLMFPCVGYVSKLLFVIIPKQPELPDPDAPKHLDKTAYMDPNLALGNAKREVLSIGDYLLSMIVNVGKGLNSEKNSGPDNHTLKSRIRRIASDISDYLSGISCDSDTERKKLKQCLLTSVKISESAQIIQVIEKRLLKIIAVYGSQLSQEDRNSLAKINDCCKKTFEYAMGSFALGGKEAKVRFVESRREFMGLINNYSAARFAIGSVKPGQDSELRFNMSMLEMLEHYRQMSGVFESLSVKSINNVKQSEE